MLLLTSICKGLTVSVIEGSSSPRPANKLEDCAANNKIIISVTKIAFLSKPHKVNNTSEKKKAVNLTTKPYKVIFTLGSKHRQE